MFTISVLVRREKTAEQPGHVVNEYDFEHIPAALIESDAGRARLEEGLAAFRRIMERQ